MIFSSKVIWTPLNWARMLKRSTQGLSFHSWQLVVSCTCNETKAAKKAKTDKTGWDPQPRYKELQGIHFGSLFLFETTWCDLFFSFLLSRVSSTNLFFMGVFCFDYKWHGIFITWVPRQVSGQLPPSPTTAEVVAASQLALFRKSGVAAFAAEVSVRGFSSSYGGVKSQLITGFLSWKPLLHPCFERRTSSSRKWWLSRERPKSCWRRLGFSL